MRRIFVKALALSISALSATAAQAVPPSIVFTDQAGKVVSTDETATITRQCRYTQDSKGLHATIDKRVYFVTINDCVKKALGAHTDLTYHVVLDRPQTP